MASPTQSLPYYFSKKEIEVTGTEKFKKLSIAYDKIIHENELLRKSHPWVCFRKVVATSLLVAALAAGIIGAAIGCVVTSVIGFGIAAVACVPVMFAYGVEAKDLVDEEITREEQLKNHKKG